MAHPPQKDDEPALTQELRDIMHPRTGRLLVALVLIAVVLGGLVLLASRSVLAQLWR